MRVITSQRGKRSTTFDKSEGHGEGKVAEASLAQATKELDDLQKKFNALSRARGEAEEQVGELKDQLTKAQHDRELDS